MKLFPPASAEYLPAQPAPPAQPTTIIIKKTSLLSPLIWAVATGILLGLALTFGRQWYDSLLVRWAMQTKAHQDQSTITHNIQPQIKRTLPLIYRRENGEIIRVLANPEEYSQFVREHLQALEQVRIRIKSEAEQQLKNEIATIFTHVQKNIPRFADWYFAYPTTYELLWQATQSTARHTVSLSATNLQDMVAYDLENFLQQQYENIVLRPEITDTQLRNAYFDALNTAHRGYLTSLSLLQNNFYLFIENQTTHTEIIKRQSVKIHLDWRSQLKKFNMADYQKGSTLEALQSGILVLGGSIAGKTIGSVVGKTAGSRLIATTASKATLSKFATPFVNKAVLAGASGTVGTLGGPIGAAVGIGVGLGVDYALNEGIELMQRDEFIADMQYTTAATQTEWEIVMQSSLKETVDVWIDDTIQLLEKFEKQSR